MEKIVVFGTGRFYENRKHLFNRSKIVALIDNNSQKQNTVLDEHIVSAPDKLALLEYDYVIIMSTYFDEMKQQLLDLNVDSDKILSFKEYQREIMGTPYYMFQNPKFDCNKKTVVLVSHAMDLSGAPIVLFHYARNLKKLGYEPIVLCKTDGDLRRQIWKSDITVIICEDISCKNPFIWGLLCSSVAVVVNTVVQYELIQQLNGKSIPTIWWLHETKVNYDLACVNGMVPFKLEKNIHPYAVGRVAQQEFYNYFGYNADKLIYGIPDFYNKGKIIFAVIGTLTQRKGQDTFVEAIEQLPTSIREKAEFLIIGGINKQEKEYCDYILEKVKSIDNLKYEGLMKREEIENLFAKIDVVVMPSREDPMPVVLVEGMMNEKICLTSDATAVADFITDGQNGFVCPADDVDALTKRIQWIIEHYDELEHIGINARKVYDGYFKEEVFMNHIEKIIKDVSNDELN